MPLDSTFSAFYLCELQKLKIMIIMCSHRHRYFWCTLPGLFSTKVDNRWSWPGHVDCFCHC